MRGSESTYSIIIRDLTLETVIGFNPSELFAPQPIVINLRLDMKESPSFGDDNRDSIVCYAAIVKKISDLVLKERVELLETLAEKIARTCLEDKRIGKLYVRIEKTNIIPKCAGVGIEIERYQNETAP